MLTIESLSTACTTLFATTFPLYASFAKVVVAFPGTYLDQFGAGDTAGFLTKLATIVCIVCDRVTSGAVAVGGLNVPKISGTVNRSVSRKEALDGERAHVQRSARPQRQGKVEDPRRRRLGTGAISGTVERGGKPPTVGVSKYIRDSRTHSSAAPKLRRAVKALGRDMCMW